MVSLREWYQRAFEGPVFTERQWNVYSGFLTRLTELADEYGIVRDPMNYIPTDPNMADSLFNAGMDLLEERGMYCQDTARVIKFTRKEIKENLRKLPQKIHFGDGTERVTVKKRTTGDKREPTRMLGGGSAGVTSPELFLKAHLSVAMEDIEILENGVLTQIGGKRVRLGTPEEYYAASMGTRLLREAVRRAGKPGMPINFDSQAMTEYAHSAILVPGGARSTDIWTFWPSYPSGIVRMVSLNRAAISLEYGNPIFAYASGSLYGYSGGPETSAIAMVADGLGVIMLDNCWNLQIGGARPIFGPSGTPENFWTQGLAGLSVFRNIDGIIGGGGGGSKSGLCTEMQFYEIAVGRIRCEPQAAFTTGGATGHGSEDDYINGLTARWNVELGEEIVGLSLADANDMVKTLMMNPKYLLGNEPDGKRFQEVYDLETATPRKEYLEMYQRTTREVKNLLGINPK
jgi:methylamine--corrinoid protein Co-methyltransferase